MARRERPHETAFRADVLRVVSWRSNRAGDELTVTLEATTLDRGSNVTLVGQYDALAGGGRAPSASVLLGHAGGMVTTEVHRWARDEGGTWRRAAATVHFLAN